LPSLSALLPHSGSEASSPPRSSLARENGRYVGTVSLSTYGLEDNAVLLMNFTCGSGRGPAGAPMLTSGATSILLAGAALLLIGYLLASCYGRA